MSQALQNKGCRVEIMALDNVSKRLRLEADLFMSGYLIPNLIPTRPGGNGQPDWGELGSRARGWCYWHDGDKGYGFMRMLKRIASGLWLTDSRHPDSPYETVYFHDSQLRDFHTQRLPNRHCLFEFEIAEARSGDGTQATDIHLVSEH